jgi:trimethylamine--corrinoid protein Co-methyltransferase
VFENRMPRYDVLSEEAMATLERGWRRLVSEIGIEFLHEEALALFRQAGQTVEGEVVRLDPDFVVEQVAKAPGSFPFTARNPARSVRFGGDAMIFTPVGSAPFVREGDERRTATFDDYRRFVRLSHVVPDLDTVGYPVCDPSDMAIDSRHLDLLLTLYTDSDKPLGCASFHEVGALDSIAMAEIAFGREALEASPHMFGVINANSPLRFDTRMIGALLELARANQVVVVTPFILMGAMGPVSVPAALAQQTAETLAGIALAQLARPGSPCVMGSFVSHTDMQSGSPGFGGPESAVGLLASGQLARRFGLPWRAGGGALTSSQTADAQAAFEGLNTMLPAFLAGANLLLHTAGWLESGLVASYEKFVLDIEIVRILREEFRPLEIDDASLAFDAHLEVGHGGHFFGAAHTLERFRECFYRPLLFSTENYERWSRRGGLEASARAAERWRTLLDSYEEPPLDPDLRARLEAYVERRRRELGD